MLEFRRCSDIALERLAWLPAVVALLCTALLTGCGEDAGSTSSAPDTFIFARGSDATKLDPADVDDGESITSLAQPLEGLLRFKPGTLEVQPQLAESYTISEDGLTYTFKLREGVTFHDGTPFNADAVLFSFKRQMDAEHPAHFPDAAFQYWNYLYTDIADVRAVDDMTVEFTLSQPNASITYSLASFPGWIISPAAFEKLGQKIQQTPVGTGAYKFVEWRPDEAIIYERFDDYWGEKADFQRLVLRPISDNTTRLLALKSGDVHAINGLVPAEIPELEADPRFTVYAGPGMNVGYVAVNSMSERLSNPEIRHAIAQAIDRESIIDLAYESYGTVAEWPLPPGFLGHPGDEAEPPIKYDPEAAKAVFKKYKDQLTEPVQLYTLNEPRPYFPDPRKVASLIEQDLEAAGLPVEVVVQDRKNHFHSLRNGEHELGMLGWTGDNGDTDNFLSIFFGSWAAEVGSANNIAFYKNPEMDDILLKARAETKLEGREELYEQALQIWARDMPLIPIVHSDQFVVTRKEVTGFTLERIGTAFLGPVGWDETAGEAAE